MGGTIAEQNTKKYSAGDSDKAEMLSKITELKLYVLKAQSMNEELNTEKVLDMVNEIQSLIIQ